MSCMVKKKKAAFLNRTTYCMWRCYMNSKSKHMVLAKEENSVHVDVLSSLYFHGWMLKFSKVSQRKERKLVFSMYKLECNSI